MKLTISRDTLAPALAALSRIVERRNTIPILSNILLAAKGEVLTLRATDLDIEARTTLPCTAEIEGALTLPAQTLTDIVGKLPAGADITLATEGEKVILRSGRSRFQLHSLPESDFPDITAGEFSHRFEMAAATLAEMIASTQFAISTEETRYYLNGIHLHTTEADGAPVLRAVATDGHRLARLQMAAPEGAAGMPGIIVPRKTVGELARMAKDAKGDLAVEISATKIRITAGATTLTSKLIDGTFPDYQRVIPAGNDKRATVEAEAFRQAIDRVSTISSERGRAVKLSLSDAGLTLSVSNPDSGAATEELSPDYAGPPVEIGFNSRYLLDVLTVLGGDTVAMKLADAGSPAIFESRDNAPLLIVLMPMRV
ncbi:DNA polymerase-3 subunit beta [Bosea sp. OAE506]|uniref:DNA polymerase III subunit beta n=1 Tax=Bosea sp. OAE506 TaxID=2663870 RepID=UPI0017895CEB